jgi:hypothetical protein
VEHGYFSPESCSIRLKSLVSDKHPNLSVRDDENVLYHRRDETSDVTNERQAAAAAAHQDRDEEAPPGILVVLVLIFKNFLRP